MRTVWRNHRGAWFLCNLDTKNRDLFTWPVARQINSCSILLCDWIKTVPFSKCQRI
ncbi:uncharacterized protein BYT42DRAFT_575319 [Radiomyces spectabilis]|uniref:uncharacterized protein n=1 Tax=Radiomyces spectabilis TaxID=64574 RepID=UPI00221EFC23|nr:uncharacterized protein BYT42DRAFT_575319 [Radiomyces spectabilis]KAI8374162.1 hypothetical protein BYT42DRAFT_575319 [Radiomyces spectabilis]